MPAGDPYRKRQLLAEGVRMTLPSTAPHRRAMVRLAIAGNTWFVLDDREIRREGPTYTLDTLEELAREGYNSAGQLILVLGSDAIADMPNWKQPERIRALARIVVAAKDAVLPPGTAADDVVRMPPLPISSTLIRARVAAGQPIRYLVPEGVEAYIRQHGLYGRPDTV
jgi:nicotinate-nucleotide adenylyltransferase